jgi:CO/xanthine dehydrogenase Mo-binding subunit
MKCSSIVVAEDCGTMVNPMLVEGQIRGGVVQGIGTALFEEIPSDDAGQPLTGTLADYLMPGAAESSAAIWMRPATVRMGIWHRGNGMIVAA